MQKNMEAIYSIIAEALRMDSAAIHDHLCMEDMESWDSVTHLDLINLIEKKYQVFFEADDIVEMLSVKVIKEKLQNKLSLSSRSI